MKRTIFCLLSLFTILNAQEVDPNELKCLVCRSTVEEIETVLADVNPAHQTEFGSYRLDSDGNMIRKKIPLAKSEVYLSEVLEGICKKLDDYVRARYKSNGQLTIFNLLSSSGSMNSEMSKVDIIQDGDLNRSLKYICDQIVGEHDDEIIKILQSDETDNINAICTTATKICDDEISPDDKQDEDSDEIDRTEL
ncbi:protein seele [Chelonus insularis]|uniref:protein seele n=1 Tax=Chelonus insularis TaxID=460826 RepID=UPI00158A7E3D|nr:protein seele [Chelonus insularis]XP_034944119.1 protein seele [Chelonus insularis]XP_034944123.1 protein seele [Chelonus insularis]